MARHRPLSQTHRIASPNYGPSYTSNKGLRNSRGAPPDDPRPRTRLRATQLTLLEHHTHTTPLVSARTHMRLANLRFPLPARDRQRTAYECRIIAAPTTECRAHTSTVARPTCTTRRTAHTSDSSAARNAHGLSHAVRMFEWPLLLPEVGLASEAIHSRVSDKPTKLSLPAPIERPMIPRRRTHTQIRRSLHDHRVYITTERLLGHYGLPMTSLGAAERAGQGNCAALGNHRKAAGKAFTARAASVASKRFGGGLDNGILLMDHKRKMR